MIRPLGAVSAAATTAVLLLLAAAPTAGVASPSDDHAEVQPRAAARLSVSDDRPVVGDTVRAKAVLGDHRAAACTLTARRTDGPGRRDLGRSPVRDGVARWRFSTERWSAGRWQLRADCGSLDLRTVIRVVPLPGPPPASGSFTTPTVTTTPALTPSYRPDVQDYVVACQAGVPVEVRVGTAPGTWVSVDRRPWVTGAVSATVPLAAGQRFVLQVAGGGRTETASIRCLPPDFPRLTATGAAPDAWYGFTLPYLSGSPYLILVDRLGTPVWWYRDTEFGNPVDLRFWSASELSDFGWSDRVALSWVGGRTYTVKRLDGSEIHRWGRGLELDRHDLVPTGRGTVMTIRYLRRDCPAVPAECVDMTRYGGGPADRVVDAQIVELDRRGRIVWSWSSRDDIAVSESSRLLDHPAEPARMDDGSWDLVHMNSVEPVRNGVVFSARHLDAVYRVNRSTGAVVWKLGGTPTRESLTVVGDDVTGPTLGMQHDARLLPDGTWSVYDNGSTVGRPPRMIRFAVDPADGTATVAGVLRDSLVASSGFAGSARLLPSGDWLMAWGGQPLISVNRPDGTRVLSIAATLPNGDRGVPYRAVSLSRDRLPASTLRAGMDAMFPRR